MSDRNVSRRTFIKLSGAAGAGLVIGACVPVRADGKSASKADKADKSDKSFAPNVWVQIDPNGQTTITVSKVDIGQGVRTSMAMIVADELDVDWQDVKVVQAPGDSQTYGNQGVGGSGSTMGLWNSLRQAGAAARHMLLTAAAQAMSVQPGGCQVANGVVTHPGTNKKMTFGELAALAAALPAPEASAVKLKSPADWRIIGKPTKRVDNPDVVTGKAAYALDPKVPGALTAVIEMPHVFGSRPANVDDTATKAVQGVTHVLSSPFGVVVVAENTFAALKGRQALKIEWEKGPNANFSTQAMRDAMKAMVEAWPTPSDKAIEAQYELPYLAHACMEPLCCTVVPESGKATVYIGSQFPDGPRNAVARELGIERDQVTVNVTLAGGGFGRRSGQDFAQQAAWIAKQTGKPIRLQWTREDDIRHDNYRPSSHHACRAILGDDGLPTVIEHQFIQAGGGRGRGGGDGYRNSGTWYKIPQSIRSAGVPSPVPNGAWRSVANSQFGFVIESFVDELAHAAGKDPYQYRKSLISNPRLMKVLDAAAEKAGWGKPLPAGHAQGIACFSGWNSHIAHVAEVSVDKSGMVRVHKIVAAVDCGTEVNPLSIEAQLEGGAMDGITCALKARITVNGGGVVQSNWGDYDWLRIDEAPTVEIVHLPSGDGPGGMGEVGVPSSAPAVANAVFAATKKRMRRLPIRPQDLAD